LQQHILEEQRRRFPHATGEFSWLLSGITLAAKIIESRVRRAGLSDILGATGEDNVQGEAVQKLDVFANQALLHCLGARGNVAVMASEEDDKPIVVPRDRQHGRYVVVYDPLDGSSNIDVNVSVGTIFAIFRRKPDPRCERDPLTDVLQPGTQQLAAGYVVYGSSTMLVYTAGNGVHGFTLDPAIGAFVISHENIKMPAQGNLYSVNEANADTFPEGYRRFLARLRAGEAGQKYSSRYIGSLVADFHRTLLKGGIFLYPPTAQHPRGKLRLMYEANPIAFLAEQSGGLATDGDRRILDIAPTGLHQRTPLLVGSRVEMELLKKTLS
jgi:fructose-1,6-bisphosphatase I